MSGGKDNKPTTTTTATSASGPPAWATPYYQDLLSRSSAVSQQPYNPYQGQRQAGFSPDQLVAQQMTRDNAFAGSDSTNMARQRLNGTIAGQGANPYAAQLAGWNEGGNPQLDNVINSTNGDITRAYGSAMGSQLGQFASGGAFGGSAHQEAMANSNNELGQNLARNTSNLRFTDYNNQQDRRFSGLGQAAGYAAGDLDRQQQAALGIGGFNSNAYGDANALNQSGGDQMGLWQQMLNNDYGDWQQQQGWPTQQLGVLGNALNSIGGSFSSSSNSNTGANPNYVSTGQQAAGWAALLGSMFGKG